MKTKVSIFLWWILWCGLFPVHSAVAQKGTSDFDCVIEPFMTVELSTSIRGTLEEVSVKRGDLVKKGQVVARLRSGVEEAGVQLAKAQAESKTQIEINKERFALSLRKLKRVNELYEKNMVPKNEQDEAATEKILAELEVLRAEEGHRIAGLELNRAREVLDLRSIVSPINGVVVERLKSPGEFVEEQPVVKLAQIDPLNVEVIAPITYLGKIKTGMKATVFPENPVGGSYKAEVKIVDSVVDAASGTFGIRLELPNPKNKVVAGLKCGVQFPIK
ncbi:efflux RND transporter periplasmic adaptor subunit [Nitrospina gracilis]|uniref:efflux RND transporter periplasmic adaptor subunit n=1 Tax=Nitrospina gracilis TaxID=35801 RepID=UPI001F0167AD|nr:efflux RND transporter periplasmic adaptor subunit [Nitrospina gracilis]MCF8721414.1 RND family efflux transporter MFP subunit [Nitrospina gracilis Nb-211]